MTRAGNDLDWGFKFVMNNQQLLLTHREEFLKQPHLNLYLAINIVLGLLSSACYLTLNISISFTISVLVLVFFLLFLSSFFLVSFFFFFVWLFTTADRAMPSAS